MDEMITCTKAELFEVLLRWELDFRAGKTIPLEEALKKTPEQCAQENVAMFFDQLKKIGAQYSDPAQEAGNTLQAVCHLASAQAGWWHHKELGDTRLLVRDPSSRIGKALVAEKLCLVHSEVSEAMEGHRKSQQDDKLPHRPMVEVELADAVIRIGDLAGAMNLDLGGAIAEKLAFNRQRPDHRKEAREAAGGKAY